MYGKCVEDLACVVMDSQAISDAKLWHARFGHLNFASLLRLQKFEMVSSLPKLEAPVKHVCEGCILGKMQHASFPKDESIRAERRLQLIHSDVCGPMHHMGFGSRLSCVPRVYLPGVPPRHCKLSLHMRLGMVASHPLVICVFLVALHMH